MCKFTGHDDIGYQRTSRHIIDFANDVGSEAVARLAVASPQRPSPNLLHDESERLEVLQGGGLVGYIDYHAPAPEHQLASSSSHNPRGEIDVAIRE